MNTNPEPQIPEPPIDVEDLRPHVYDGIQEYDKRLPNWWLWTFYGAIIYAIGYWIIMHMMGVGGDPGIELEGRMARARAVQELNATALSDEKIWAMSREPEKVAAGAAIYTTTCASCHRADLKGLIGPNLVDQEWVHGGNPLTIVRTIDEGVLAKGMPAWRPILGQERILEVVSFILSHHQEGEPVEIKPWVPVMPGVPPAPAAAGN